MSKDNNLKILSSYLELLLQHKDTANCEVEEFFQKHHQQNPILFSLLSVMKLNFQTPQKG